MTLDLPIRAVGCALVCWFAAALPIRVQAGGSGLNVLVVANEVSPNSCELANYFIEQRNIPPENFLRISWSGGNVQWTKTEFDALLLNPLLNFLAADSQRSNQIHYVVLSMDIPYRVVDGPNQNSITSALFYGFKDGSSPGNSYGGSEDRFAFARPDTAPGYSFLTTMLTAGSLDEAKQLVDQGVASDGSWTSETAWLVKTSDPSRNIRYRAFDNAIFNTRLCQSYSLVRTNSDSTYGSTNLFGCQTGLANFSVSPNAFVPGAMADSMTSFGGQIFEGQMHGQTTLLEFIHAGASGSYGTVTEPLASVKKFPDPQVYFYQSRGFTLAECYYQGLASPYQGLMVGDPLAAPYRTGCSGYWGPIGTNGVLQGTANLCINVSAIQPTERVEKLDLFLNGVYDRTLTNLSPRAGNRLTVRIGGYSVEYEVPTDATLTSIASDLANLLNQSTNSDVTKVQAQAFGDRIELQSLSQRLPVGTFEFVDSDASTAAPRVYHAVRIPYWVSAGMSPVGSNGDGDFVFEVDSQPSIPYTIEATTNFVDWVRIYTNVSGGLTEIVDVDSQSFPYRFYRVVPPWPQGPMTVLTAVGTHSNGAIRVYIESPTNRGSILQASSDLSAWSDLFTDETGGGFEFVDMDSTNAAVRYYRTRSTDTNDYSPISIVGQTGTGGNILRVEDSLPARYIVWASTNGTDWQVVWEQSSLSSVQIEVDSASGGGEPRTTWLSAARTAFLESTAQGIRKFSVELDFLTPKLTTNSFLELSVTKTNGSVVTVSVTNLPGNNSDMVLFVQQLRDAVNAHPELLSNDGLSMDDLTEGFFGAADFNFRARSSGWEASAIDVHLTGSSDLNIYLSGFVPHMAPVKLDQNVSDLRSRNHLYVSSGRPNISVYFDLDTTLLPDGHHELTAVAYGGNSVYSQSHFVLPVVVDNTPLEATISSPASDLTISVTNSFDITVEANTNTVDEILLFSTGGLLDIATNQATNTFIVDGQQLGVGTHPFHAMVNTSGGMSYRTETIHVTLAGQ